MFAPKVTVSIPIEVSSTSRVVFSDVNYACKDIISDELTFNLQAIGQSLMTILSTYRKQRLFHPTFGSNLEMYLFDPVDEITAYNIKNEILQAFSEWEHRVVINSKDVVVTALLDEEMYSVEVRYSIPQLEDVATLSFNLSKDNK